jgi:hypothetical protein
MSGVEFGSGGGHCVGHFRFQCRQTFERRQKADA